MTPCVLFLRYFTRSLKQAVTRIMFAYIGSIVLCCVVLLAVWCCVITLLYLSDPQCTLQVDYKKDQSWIVVYSYSQLTSHFNPRG
jgi:hypothetical protein